MNVNSMKLKFLTSKYTIYCCLCRRFIEVHGRPSNLSFYYSEHLSSPHYYQVKWSTTSYYMVDMFTLLYRKVKFIIYKMFKNPMMLRLMGLMKLLSGSLLKYLGQVTMKLFRTTAGYWLIYPQPPLMSALSRHVSHSLLLSYTFYTGTEFVWLEWS